MEAEPEDAPRSPRGDAGPVSKLGAAEGAIHHLVFLLSGSRLPPSPPPRVHTLVLAGKPKARLDLLIPGGCSRAQGDWARPGWDHPYLSVSWQQSCPCKLQRSREWLLGLMSEQGC